MLEKGKKSEKHFNSKYQLTCIDEEEKKIERLKRM